MLYKPFTIIHCKVTIDIYSTWVNVNGLINTVQCLYKHYMEQL